MTWLIPIIPALAVGFTTGFVTHRKSRRWCVVCGSNLRCPDCTSLLARHPHAGNTRFR